jgi:hypothetical protein
LHHIQNVAVFSIQCNGMSALEQLSGGDYDGDHVLVIWNVDILKYIQPLVSAGVEEAIERERWEAAKATSNEISISNPHERHRQAQSLFLEQLLDMELGRISNYWLAYAIMLEECDWLTEKEERELATLCEIAVDATKTGKKVRLPEYFKPMTWPHCMSGCKPARDQFNLPVACNSNHIIGQIYDRCQEEQQQRNTAKYRTEVKADFVLEKRWQEQMELRSEATRVFVAKAETQIKKFYQQLKNYCDSKHASSSSSGKKTNRNSRRERDQDLDSGLEWSSIVQESIEGFWSDWPALPLECRHNILTLLRKTDEETLEAMLDKASVYYFVAWQKAFNSPFKKSNVEEQQLQHEHDDGVRKMVRTNTFRALFHLQLIACDCAQALLFLTRVCESRSLFLAPRLQFIASFQWFVWASCFEILLFMKTIHNGTAIMCANNRQHLLFQR